MVSGPQTAVAITSAMQDVVNTIIGIGKSLGIPQYGWAIAIATAMDESTLGSSPYMNDPTESGNAYGVFQQTPTDGLMQISGWESMSITAAAHAVQQNADPTTYNKFAQEAQQLAAAGVDLAAVALPYPATVTYGPPLS